MQVCPEGPGVRRNLAPGDGNFPLGGRHPQGAEDDNLHGEGANHQGHTPGQSRENRPELGMERDFGAPGSSHNFQRESHPHADTGDGSADARPGYPQIETVNEHGVESYVRDSAGDRNHQWCLGVQHAAHGSGSRQDQHHPQHGGRRRPQIRCPLNIDRRGGPEQRNNRQRPDPQDYCQHHSHQQPQPGSIHPGLDRTVPVPRTQLA